MNNRNPGDQSINSHLVKNLPEIMQCDTVVQQLLQPGTSYKFDFSSNPNVKQLPLEQRSNNDIVKMEGNQITQKISGEHTITYDKNKTIVNSQWINCVVDPKTSEFTDNKDGIFIKHCNEVAGNPAVANDGFKYHSASVGGPGIWSHNFTNVFVYEPKEQIFNVDFGKNIIYPAPK